MGHSLGKKIWGKAVSIGKKLGKVAAVGGALLVGGAYAMGKKELNASERQRDEIRERAIASEMERAGARPSTPPPPPPQSGGGGGVFKVVKRKDKSPHTIDPATGNIVLKKDKVAMGVAEGPTQDPMDAAYSAAMEGKEAAEGFEAGKKKGGLVRKMKFW